MTTSTAPSFLIIRRDNIGDLVCTTPLIHAIRQHFPGSRICALINSYNRAVLEGNPDIDQIYTYTKAKHRAAGQSAAAVYVERLKTIWALRRQRFDYVVLAAPGFQQRSLLLARLINARHVVGFVPPGKHVRQIDLALPYAPPRPVHEVEDTFALASRLGIREAPGPVQVYAPPLGVTAAKGTGCTSLPSWTGPIIGIHISARKPSQRWPVERFAELAQMLHERYDARFLLFWAPGTADDPRHPGDDEKAASLKSMLQGAPVRPFPTTELSELIAGLAVCDMVVCSDGGAMHLAAGLGKPILCFFGKSGVGRWHPWGVPYVALQPPSEDVADISVADALNGYEALQHKAGAGAQARGENQPREE